MARNRHYQEPNKEPRTVKGECQKVYELATIGLSKKSIASRLGYLQADFQKLLDHEVAGIHPFQHAYESGRAEFEENNARVLDEILENPEVSEGIKAKIARDNLKTIEEWAPASKTVKVQVEDAGNVFHFEALTEEEQAAIKAENETDESTEEDPT